MTWLKLKLYLTLGEKVRTNWCNKMFCCERWRIKGALPMSDMHVIWKKKLHFFSSGFFTMRESYLEKLREHVLLLNFLNKRNITHVRYACNLGKKVALFWVRVLFQRLRKWGSSVQYCMTFMIVNCKSTPHWGRAESADPRGCPSCSRLHFQVS